MNVATRPAGPAAISDTEWQIRRDLAALYRLVAHHRWTDSSTPTSAPGFPVPTITS